MDLNKLKEEQRKYKKSLKTFIILEVISYVLFITTIVLYCIGLVGASLLFTDATISEDKIAVIMIVFMLYSVYGMMIFGMATEAFIPFIIVNAIKLGKRNKLIEKLESEGVING